MLIYRHFQLKMSKIRTLCFLFWYPVRKSREKIRVEDRAPPRFAQIPFNKFCREGYFTNNTLKGGGKHGKSSTSN
nr:MAG TPA: hypothetical protein [Caudoviricetes sp.]